MLGLSVPVASTHDSSIEGLDSWRASAEPNRYPSALRAVAWRVPLLVTRLPA